MTPDSIDILPCPQWRACGPRDGVQVRRIAVRERRFQLGGLTSVFWPETSKTAYNCVVGRARVGRFYANPSRFRVGRTEGFTAIAGNTEISLSIIRTLDKRSSARTLRGTAANTLGR